jgi:hypothetical protein
MPTVYQQTFVRLESGGRKIEVRVVVGDDHPSLYSMGPTAPQVNILRIGTKKSDLDTSEATFAEDELSFELDLTASTTSDDAACAALVLAAQDDLTTDGTPANLRFILVQIDEDGTGFVDVFSGRILAGMDAEDKRWYGAEFSTTPAPVRVWKCTAQSFSNYVLDIPLNDLLDYAGGTMPNNDNAGLWQYNNTFYGLTYPVRYPTGTSNSIPLTDYDRVGYYGLLVEVNALHSWLGRLATYYTGVYSQGVNVIFDTCTLPYEFGTPELVPSLNNNNEWRELKKIDGRDTNKHTPVLGDSQSGFYVSILQLYPQFNPVVGRPLTRGEGNPRFSLLDYFYQFARNFGLFIKLYRDDTGDIHVRFIPRDQVQNDENDDPRTVYLRDATKASVKVSIAEQKADDAPHYVGRACPWALEGRDEYEGDLNNYTVQSEIGRQYPKRTESALSKGADGEGGLLYTIGMTTRRSGSTVIPHNSTKKLREYINILQNSTVPPWTPSPAVTTEYPEKIPSLLMGGFNWAEPTTTIYLRTQENRYSLVSGNPVKQVTTYYGYRPVTVMAVEEDSVVKEYTELAEYLNSVRTMDTLYYAAEYTITVPYITGFRAIVGGTQSYFNLMLGATITLDGDDYTLVGTETNFDTLEVTLRLQYRSRFQRIATGTLDTQTGTETTKNDNPGMSGDNVEEKEVDGAVTAGEAVAYVDSIRVRRATPTDIDYRRVIGVALNSAVDGEFIEVARSGMVELPADLTTIAGESVWLVPDTYNLSTTPPDPDAVDCHYLQRIGIMVKTNLLLLMIEEPDYFEEYAP